MAELENIPAEEAAQIDNIVRLTLEQLTRRYITRPGEPFVRRGVHPKDHGCVTAKFKILDAVPEALRVGVFATPGREYDAFVRFSNADVLVKPDSTEKDAVISHGSRGMAVKLLGVEGAMLMPEYGPQSQDLLMINQPVFAFSNVEDYEALSRILQQDNDVPNGFFKERIRRAADGKPDLTDPATQRAVASFGIVSRIKNNLPPVHPDSPATAYQKPPASPVDNQYFSGSAFLFGEGRAMKFSAKPIAPVWDEEPDMADDDYLRTALRRRLASDVVFDFMVQVRTADELADKLDTQIEDACCLWKEEAHAFVAVATLTIPAQDFETPDRHVLCEALSFSPWHGLVEHRPLGGINRLRKAVYVASSQLRHLPKEPTHA